MCEPKVKVTAGAMLVAALSPRVTLGVMAVTGSGVALVVVAGTALNAYVWMVLTGWAAIATILLLRRRADPVRHMAAPPSQPAPQRAHAQILAARPRALPAADPAVRVIERHAAESR